MFTNLIEKESESSLKRNPERFDWFYDDENRLFFLENNTGRKRFARLVNCDFCSVEFCIRLNDKNKYCSKECSQKSSRLKRVIINCSNCNKEIERTGSRVAKSKNGLHFCDRKCKENAQKIGGIPELQPSHYGDGLSTYADKAFKKYGEKCVNCDISFRPLLEVHHIDGNRENAEIENLEVVCKNHHLLRHLRKNEKTDDWVLDFKYLTPRDMLEFFLAGLLKNKG